MLQIELLGGFEAWLARDRALVFGQRKAQAILAYLALAPDHTVPRARLVHLLWSERGEDQAKSSLRQALTALRKGLREAAPDATEPLVSVRETLALAAEQVDVDAVRFARLAQSSDIADLQAADALYRGDLLDGFALAELPFQEWLERERERLRELAFCVLQSLAAQHEELGAFEAAIEVARRAVAFDPLRESAHRTLMRLFDTSGQSGQALRQYESCSDILLRDLGVRPDAETERLYEGIRVRRGPAPAANLVPAAPADTAPAVIALPDKPSIAVLPFKNMGGNPGEDFFADGMAEDILTALSKFRWFFVIARDSSFHYRGVDVDERQAGAELGVRYVLTGSVRRAGKRVRISARLIDGPDGHHIWAENYDRDMEDVFEVQDEITQCIVTAVAPQFLNAEIKRARRRDVQDLDAWGYVVRAHAHLARLNKADNAEARELLTKAIARDPDSAWGYTGLAISHTQDALWGWSASRVQSILAAQQNAERAISLDDGDAQAYAVIGLVRLVSRRHADAIETLERAIELNPNLANAHASLGLALAFCGNTDAAVDEVNQAIRLSPRDPLSVFWFNTLSLAAFVAGRYEEAAAWAEKTIELNDEYAGGYRILAASYGQLEYRKKAAAALARLAQLSPGMTLGGTRAQLPFKADADMTRFLDGLRAAGLKE
ncbi:MAG: BTAD domain-containing putative transcriptional regulator [Proteobacteria bacterium]|nr:BTAD domain-containing putative transcriptional regulator [Pseudomonadota bacterium]